MKILSKQLPKHHHPIKLYGGTNTMDEGGNIRGGINIWRGEWLAMHSAPPPPIQIWYPPLPICYWIGATAPGLFYCWNLTLFQNLLTNTPKLKLNFNFNCCYNWMADIAFCRILKEMAICQISRVIPLPLRRGTIPPYQKPKKETLLPVPPNLWW